MLRFTTPMLSFQALNIPASIATLAQRRHWSASSRSAVDVAPTLVFRHQRCYGMSAFCRSATVGISLFADVLCLDIGGWKSSVSRINVVVQRDYRYINYIFRHHDPKNYCTSNLNKMYHFAASILFYDIAQLRFPPKAIRRVTIATSQLQHTATSELHARNRLRATCGSNSEYVV